MTFEKRERQGRVPCDEAGCLRVEGLRTHKAPMMNVCLHSQSTGEWTQSHRSQFGITKGRMDG